MKIKSWLQPVAGGGPALFALGAMMVWLATGFTARAAGAAELLEKGIYTEETKGDLAAARDLYQQIVADPGADRSLAAQAQLRLGFCELKLGNKPQAIKELEQLTLAFPDKEVLLQSLDQQMPRLLDEMIKQIEQNYVLEVDRSELVQAAIHAIIGKLGSNAGFLRTNDMAFLDPTEVKDMNINVEQKFGGIGAVLRADTETKEIITEDVLPGSPAIQGGLHAGDRILKINGAPTPEDNLKETVELLRGLVGTPVTLTVKRAGSPELFQLTLMRDVIRLSSVNGALRKPDQSWDFMLDEERKIGYVQITYGAAETLKDVKAALKDLKAHDLKAFILDLRDDPGGTLDSAIAVSDLFVDDGRIVTVKGRSGDKAYDATAEGGFGGFPIAVLVNRRTASAAEIIAACLQDHHRAVVIGERTVGQGLVKSMIQLKDGMGGLKLPVGTFYRPNGKNMNRYPDLKDSDDWGVQPDAGCEITLPDEEWAQYDKYRFNGAINSPGRRNLGFTDRQLQKALDYLQGQLSDSPPR